MVLPRDKTDSLSSRVIHSYLYKPPNRPRSPSGKVHIPVTMRMIIKFSCAVPDIDQLILLLLIPRMWNLARNIAGFEPESVLIIISWGLMVIEKGKDGLYRTRHILLVEKGSRSICMNYINKWLKKHLFSNYCNFIHYRCIFGELFTWIVACLITLIYPVAEVYIGFVIH